MNARMDTLPRGDRRLLREASVLGNEVTLDLLGEIAEARPRRGRGDRRAGSRDFLVPVRPGTRALLARAAPRRRLLGAAVPPPPRAPRAAPARRSGRGGGEGVEELLAIHFGAARRWPETWHYGRIAGERALARAAPREAAGFLRVRGRPPRAGCRGVDRERARAGDGAARRRRGARGLLRRGAQGVREGAQARRRRPRRRGELFLQGGAAAREGRDRLPGAALLLAAGSSALGDLRSREATSVRARLILAQGATRLRGRQAPRGAAAARARGARGRARRGPGDAGPRLLPARLGAHRPRQPRGGALPRPRAADLRGARRLRQAGPGADQPRRQRLPRGPLGRGARALRARAGSPPSAPATRSAPRSTSTTSPRSGSSRGASTRPRSCCATCSPPGGPPASPSGSAPRCATSAGSRCAAATSSAAGELLRPRRARRWPGRASTARSASSTPTRPSGCCWPATPRRRSCWPRRSRTAHARST